MDDSKSEPKADVYEVLEELLDARDVRGVLAFLNSRAPHRFTGIYHIDPPTLRSVRMFDRENQSLEIGADAPLRETYCSITGGTAAPYSTPDAAVDPDLSEHPAREAVLSYCGVPLLGDSGEALGTLCHFDLVPQPVPVSEIALLELAAARLQSMLQEFGGSPATP